MELIDLIRSRRSIRKYQDRQISRAELEKILEAGFHSPNAGNRQQTRVVVCRDSAVNERIGKAHSILIRKYNQSCADKNVGLTESDFQDQTLTSAFHGAPVVIMLFGPKNFYFTDADAYIMAENICLEACELGIGSCIIGEVLNAFSDEYGKKLSEKWKIPENYRSCAFISLGYSAEENKKAKVIKYADPLWI